MKVVGAIDIGSNAVRMSCARLTADRRIEIIDSVRSPVRLGADVFSVGTIQPATLDSLVEALKVFQRTCEQNGCEEVRTYATSACRETRNQEELVARLKAEAGIELEPISGGKEASLLQRAVQELLDLESGLHVMADLGGGSVEISVIRDGAIDFAESFRVGTVRLLRMFDYVPESEAEFVKWLDHMLADFVRGLKRHLQGVRVAALIITGGNAAAVGKLARRLDPDATSAGGGVVKVPRAVFDQVRRELLQRSYASRMSELDLGADRADVIIPAVQVFDRLMGLVKADELLVPDVGVRDGILAEMLDAVVPARAESEARQTLRSALFYAGKYQADLGHARTVRNLARQIFDGLTALHGYGHRERTYLEAAAVMHDVGRFVRPSNHHKHSQYLIQNTELVGVTNRERRIIALVARYHTRATPGGKHLEFKRLGERDQRLVCRLAAILRVADALDREHSGEVRRLSLHCDEHQVRLLAEHRGDMLLPEWSLRRKRDWFEEVFERRLVLEGRPAG